MEQNKCMEIVLYLSKKRANIFKRKRKPFARRIRTSDIRNRQLTQICEILKDEGMDTDLIETLTRIKNI